MAGTGINTTVNVIPGGRGHGVRNLALFISCWPMGSAQAQTQAALQMQVQAGRSEPGRSYRQRGIGGERKTGLKTTCGIHHFISF